MLKQEIIEEETFLFDEKIIGEIKEELEQMPRQTRKIISLIFIQNMKYQEVADEMNISINTVKTLLRNGIKHLRNRDLKKQFFFYIFAIDFGATLHFHRRVVKRESGENPEQTRCCKLCDSFLTILKPLFINEREGGRGIKQVRRPAKV